MIEITVFAAQLISSLLSTMTLYAAIGHSRKRFVFTAAISDGIKLAVLSGVAVEAVKGNWFALGAAVLGGAVGNFVAHKKQTPNVEVTGAAASCRVQRSETERC